MKGRTGYTHLKVSGLVSRDPLILEGALVCAFGGVARVDFYDGRDASRRVMLTATIASGSSRQINFHGVKLEALYVKLGTNSLAATVFWLPIKQAAAEE